MMTNTWRKVAAAVVAALLTTGCGTSPPGAGFTNGEPMLGGPEKTAARTDAPGASTSGNDAVAEAVASSPAQSAPRNETAPTSGPQAGARQSGATRSPKD